MCERCIDAAIANTRFARRSILQLAIAGSAAVVGVGQSAGDLYLAFVGTSIVVACDDAHWKIFPRP